MAKHLPGLINFSDEPVTKKTKKKIIRLWEREQRGIIKKVPKKARKEMQRISKKQDDWWVKHFGE